MDSGEGPLAEPAPEDVGVVPGGREPAAHGIDVDGPLGENETDPTGVECLHNVCADLPGASLVVDERAEDFLDRGGVVVDEACGMNDQSALDVRCVEQVAGGGSRGGSGRTA